MKTKKSLTSYSINTKKHLEFAAIFSDLSGCNFNDFIMLITLLRRENTDLLVNRKHMCVFLSGFVILVFDYSLNKPRISTSDILLDTYAEFRNIPKKTVREVSKSMREVFHAIGSGIMYLDINEVMEHKTDLILMLRRLQNHD